MFNILLFGLFSVYLVFESYKHSVTSSNKTLQIQKFNLVTYVLLVYLSLVIVLLSKLLVKNHEEFIFLLFLLFFVFLFNTCTFQLYTNFVSLTFLLSLVSYFIYSNDSIVSFIFGAELLSIVTFFVVFFNNTQRLYNTGIFYFFLNNIITFLFGVFAVIVLLNDFGTLDISILRYMMFADFSKISLLFLFFYFLLKLGQNFAVLFKFRFYRFMKFTNILYYLVVYVIFIWPLILTLLSEFFNDQINLYGLYFLIISTFMIFQSVFIYSSLIDFMVFSTWIFMWYQIIFILG